MPQPVNFGTEVAADSPAFRHQLFSCPRFSFAFEMLNLGVNSVEVSEQNRQRFGTASCFLILCCPESGRLCRAEDLRMSTFPREREKISRVLMVIRRHDYMCSIILSPNCEHLISVAPCMRRAKS